MQNSPRPSGQTDLCGKELGECPGSHGLSFLGGGGHRTSHHLKKNVISHHLILSQLISSDFYITSYHYKISYDIICARV